jgi:heptosyltransferase-2
MKILIELPTWIGDTIMVTPSIENLIKHFENPDISIIGSELSIELFRFHPSVKERFILEKKYSKIYKISKKLDYFDVFISFRSSFRSKILKFFLSCNLKYQYKKIKQEGRHQVNNYSDFINRCFKTNYKPNELKIYKKFRLFKDKTIMYAGINPGATYGDAKRWYPKKFANVIESLSKDYRVIIFGGKGEVSIAREIENLLKKNGFNNFINLAGKTSLSELIEQISKLDLFITNDSGPMHIAASFQIPTVSIFGPTKDGETSQWMNAKNAIVKKNLSCQPCMKRTCPLKHHNCMKQIESIDVLNAVESLS